MDERWRVEELAGRAGLSVDTIRFYQKRRLLEPPTREGRVAWYDQGHLDRLVLIRDLQLRGFSLALIGRVARGEMDTTDTPLAEAVATAATSTGAAPDDETLSLSELAARTGVEPALLAAIVAEGLLAAVPRDGEARFTAADIAAVKAGLRLVESGLPVDELLALARDHHAATRETAERAVAMFDTYVRTPLRDAAITDDEKAARLVEAFAMLLPAITELVSHHFRAVLLATAQSHLEKAADASAPEAAHTDPNATRDARHAVESRPGRRRLPRAASPS